MSYERPRIKVSEYNDPNILGEVGEINKICIIGSGSPFIKVENIEVVRGLTTAILDPIPGMTVGDVLDVIGVGKSQGYYNFIEDTDYKLNDYSIEWQVGQQAPDNGSTYYVSVKKKKGDEFYEPIQEFSKEQIVYNCGEEYETGVISELSVAADLAIEGGAEMLYTIQTVDGTTSGYINAIDKSKDIELDTIIVTGITNATVRNYLIDHIMEMSSDNEMKERTTIIAPVNTTDDITTIGALSSAISNTRISMIGNPKVKVNLTDSITGESSEVEFSSIMAAANIAGIESDSQYDAAEPMLGKKLSSRITLDSNYLLSEAKYLGGKGCVILEKDDSAAVSIVDMLTTDMTNAITQERSVRRQLDYVRKDLRKEFGKRFKGPKLLSGIEKRIEEFSRVKLQEYVDSALIYGFESIKAYRSISEPRKVLLSMRVSPVFPLKYIDISIIIYV